MPPRYHCLVRLLPPLVAVLLLVLLLLAVWNHPAPISANEAGETNFVTVDCETSKGPIEIAVEPLWAPLGAKRFLELVDDGFFNNVPLFRCVDDFLCQFGYVPPRRDAKQYSALRDDPLVPAFRHFKPGYVSFAGSGPNSRSNHLFITLGENVESLGTMPWETPIGVVSQASMKSVVSKWKKYGDMAPWGPGPDPRKIEMSDGEAYLKSNYPELDYLLSCRRRRPETGEKRDGL